MRRIRILCESPRDVATPPLHTQHLGTFLLPDPCQQLNFKDNMDFEDNLRFVLSTAEQLPTHIHLSEFDYKFMEGKRERKESKTLRFRKLTENELGQLLRRLQDTPRQQHVIGFNIRGNKIGPSGCSALSQALPHLSALQELNLVGNLIL